MKMNRLNSPESLNHSLDNKLLVHLLTPSSGLDFSIRIIIIYMT